MHKCVTERGPKPIFERNVARTEVYSLAPLLRGEDGVEGLRPQILTQNYALRIPLTRR